MPPIESAAFHFEREIAPHLPVLYRRARRLTGRREDAEDLVQSTLERAYRKRARLSAGDQPGGLADDDPRSPDDRRPSP